MIKESKRQLGWTSKSSIISAWCRLFVSIGYFWYSHIAIIYPCIILVVSKGFPRRFRWPKLTPFQGKSFGDLVSESRPAMELEKERTREKFASMGNAYIIYILLYKYIIYIYVYILCMIIYVTYTYISYIYIYTYIYIWLYVRIYNNDDNNNAHV